MGKSIDDILSETPDTEKAETEAQVEVEAETVAEPEAEAEDEPAESHTEKTVPVQALQEERGKRRTLEEELAAVNERLNRLTQAPPPPPPPAPDIFEDPEGFKANIQRQIDQRIFNERLNYSFELAKVRHGEDVAQKAVEWGKQRADADPLFNDAVYQQQNPIDFVVAQYKAAEVGNRMSRYTPEQIEAALAALETPAQQPAPVNVPQTTANARNVASRKGPEWSGPPSLDAILGR